MAISPLTSSGDVTLISTIKSSKLVNDWKKTFDIDIKDELLGSEEIYLYQCNRTKLFFFEPSSIAGSGLLYEKLQKYDWFYMPDKWEHQIALQNIKGSQKVLEVGCAFGAFIEAGLKSKIDIQGIEMNESAVAVARSKSLPVTNLSLETFAQSYPESLDAICSFQVLEHVQNPKDFIEWSIQSLKIGGLLIICVPNCESFLKHQHNILDMPPHHMLRWSETSFKSLEGLFPIKLQRVEREPLAAYHVSGYLESYANYFKTKNPLNKLFFNRYTHKFYKFFLQHGFRKYCLGQSLYVEFRKIA